MEIVEENMTDFICCIENSSQNLNLQDQRRILKEKTVGRKKKLLGKYA